MKHLATNRPPGKHRPRGPVVAACAALLAVAAIAAIALPRLLTPPAPDDTAGESPSAAQTPQEPVPVVDGGAVPFALDGVPYDAEVIEVTERAIEASLGDAWTFGGDYATIGSLPIDAQTVFGSATDDPESGISYAPALITREGGTAELAEPQIVDTGFWEPQDGTGSAGRIVWRESLVPFTSAIGTDNWRVRAYDATSGAVTTIGEASDINPGVDTPSIMNDVVPTANATDAFFSTAAQSDGGWVRCVVRMALDGSTGAVACGTGDYPAATATGALFARSDAGDGTESALDSVVSYDTSRDGIDTIMKIRQNDGSPTWSVCGIWSNGRQHVVAFASDDAQAGRYIGIWDASFETQLAWLHVPSQGVVGSINERWFVWGAGSQVEHAEMYAYSFDDARILYLGEAEGYSRPTIAWESDTVMLPISNGDSQAVTFDVGSLS